MYFCIFKSIDDICNLSKSRDRKVTFRVNLIKLPF